MKQKRNSIMRGVSGKLGDELVFRQRNGKTVISLPAPPRVDNPTAVQIEGRIKFGKAAKYALASLADATTKAFYESLASGDISAYNVAFKDYFSAPEIVSIDTGNYSGSPNSTIHVVAKDDGKVTSVYVSVTDSNGEVIEEGQAIVDSTISHLWTYTATTNNTAFGDGMVRVSVKDLPGNETLLEQTIV